MPCGRSIVGELPIDDEFVDFVETCVQCRGCETACPSGVQFGALMEQTRRRSPQRDGSRRGGSGSASDCCRDIACCSPVPR
jgi:Fe-S oxidoreductase